METKHVARNSLMNERHEDQSGSPHAQCTFFITPDFPDSIRPLQTQWTGSWYSSSILFGARSNLLLGIFAMQLWSVPRLILWQGRPLVGSVTHVQTSWSRVGFLITLFRGSCAFRTSWSFLSLHSGQNVSCWVVWSAGLPTFFGIGRTDNILYMV